MAKPSNLETVCGTAALERALTTATPAEPVLVDFTATWCAPCKLQGRILRALCTARTSVRVAQLDVDAEANVELSQRFKVKSVPTLQLHTGPLTQAPVKRWFGVTLQPVLELALDRVAVDSRRGA